MTLLDSAAYGTVVGRFYRGSAGAVEADVPTDLRVRFRPGLRGGVVRSETAGALFAVDEVTATVDSSGQLLGADGEAGVRLLASMSPDLTPSGWTWTVAISSPTLAAVTFAFGLEVAETIDLATVLQVPPNPGATVDAWLQAASTAQAARDEALAAAASVAAGSAAAIQDAIAALVGAAPDALDTLQEIDATIAADEGSAAALAALVATKAPRDSPTFTGTVSGITPGMISADPAGAAAAAQAASLQKTANLSDLASPSAARTALGLGTAATHPATDFDPAGAAAAVTKTSLGLGNVDNTADSAKPVSTAQAAALALKADAASVAATYPALNGSSRLAIGGTQLDATAIGADPAGAAASITLTGLGGITPAAVDTKVSAAVNGLLNGAPGALDTLKELADALGDDANFAATIANALALKATPADISTAVATQHTTDLGLFATRGTIVTVPASEFVAATGSAGPSKLAFTGAPVFQFNRTIRLIDSFNRADNAASVGTTDTGETWTAGSGTWGISGNALYNPTAGNGNRVTVPLAQNDCEVNAVFSVLPATGQVYVLHRFTDTSNYVYASVLSTGAVILGHVVGGTFTSLVTSAAGVYTAGTKLTLRAKGTAISILLNDAPLFASTTTLTTGTAAGIRNSGASSGAFRVDSFSIADEEAASAVTRVPSHWTSYDVSLLYTTFTPGSGNVRWKYAERDMDLAAGTSLAPTVLTTVTSTAPANSVIQRAYLGSAYAAPASGLVIVEVARVNADILDTLGNAVGLLAVELTQNA